MTDAERPEWIMAHEVVHDGRQPEPRDVLLLAIEVLRLRELAEVRYELLRAEKGYDVLKELKPRIDKLYLTLNAEARGLSEDVEGDSLEGGKAKWNRLVELAATALVHWIASQRWAALEHRAAEDLRAALEMVSEGAPL